MWLMLLLGASSPPSLVDAARTYMGRPYAFGGRSTSLDCMGLVFRAWTDAHKGPWKSLSVNPTEIVAERQLGIPVPGLDGTLTAAIDWSLLQPGDIVFFLGTQENVNEPSLVTLHGTPHWVWHMGIYTGGTERRFIAGDHFAGEVAEMALQAYLAEHAEVYDGVYVTRP